MTRAYGVSERPRWHHLGDGSVLVVALALVVGVWIGPAAVLAWTAIAAVVHRRWIVVVLCLTVGLIGSVDAHHAWAQAQPRTLGPYEGWATVKTDPATYGSGARVTIEIEGERFDAWLYGGRRARILDHQAGDIVWVSGVRRASSGSVRRAQVRHVVGRFDVEILGDIVDGNALSRADNRVRSALRASAEITMADPDAALFTGLVIGDDIRQPMWMVDDFRASGLSHLTAVSGQNVAFVLAAALPLLRRLRPWARWLATVGLIVWFMALTRFEPSVLRAGVMAILAATAFVLGRQPRPTRLVALAVIVLVLADPLLVWSVGFWLSVSATLGVCVVGTWLAARLPGPQWFRVGLGVTLGAQVGVALPSALVFHRLPLVSIPANLAAVPVAGFVMLYGLPAGLAAAMLPRPLVLVVMLPASVGTRWVSTVAQVAAALEPAPRWSICGWAMAVALLAWWIRHRSRHRAPGVPI